MTSPRKFRWDSFDTAPRPRLSLPAALGELGYRVVAGVVTLGALGVLSVMFPMWWRSPRSAISQAHAVGEEKQGLSSSVDESAARPNTLPRNSETSGKRS